MEKLKEMKISKLKKPKQDHQSHATILKMIEHFAQFITAIPHNWKGGNVFWQLYRSVGAAYQDLFVCKVGLSVVLTKVKDLVWEITNLKNNVNKSFLLGCLLYGSIKSIISSDFQQFFCVIKIITDLDPPTPLNWWRNNWIESGDNRTFIKGPIESRRHKHMFQEANI